MTPKLKAKELVEKFEKIIISASANSWTNESKQCAIILVQEIIQLCKDEFDYSIYSPIDYWNEVKLEIEKL